MHYKMALILLSISAMAAETVVKNSNIESVPLKMTFTETMRLAPDTGLEFNVWSGSHVGVTANDDGDMFVVDPGSYRIVQFNKDGEMVKIIGRQGEGPGEFRNISGFQILNDNTGMTFENLQSVSYFSKFNKKMKYVDRFYSGGIFLLSASFSPDGKTIAGTYSVHQKVGQTVHFGILDTDLNILKQLSSQQVDRYAHENRFKPSWWGDFISKWLSIMDKGHGYGTYDSQNRLYTAMSNKYQITRWSKDLKTKDLVFSREYKPIPRSRKELIAFTDVIRNELAGALPPDLQEMITPAVAQDAVNKARMLPIKPPIFGLLPVENHGIMVIHDYEAVSKVAKGDLFGYDGKYIGTTTLPEFSPNLSGGVLGNPNRMLFKNGNFYAISINSKDEPSLVRYAYKIKK